MEIVTFAGMEMAGLGKLKEGFGLVAAEAGNAKFRAWVESNDIRPEQIIQVSTTMVPWAGGGVHFMFSTLTVVFRSAAAPPT